MSTTPTLAELEARTPLTGPRRWRRRTKALIGIGGVVAVASSVIALDFALSDRDHRTQRFDQPIDEVAIDISGGQIDSISGDLDVSINGGDVDATFAGAPRQIKARANGGDIDIVIPNDQHSYQAEASSNGGSTKVEVRTDPSSDRTIDVHTNGGRIAVRYL